MYWDCGEDGFITPICVRSERSFGGDSPVPLVLQADLCGAAVYSAVHFNANTVLRWMIICFAALTVAGCQAGRGISISSDAVFPDIQGRSHHPVSSQPIATALIFIGIDCPIANSYAPEINRIVEDYTSQGVAFYLVHVDPSLSIDDATQHAASYGYRCPVLIDAEHRLAKAVGATVTPEAAVIGNNQRLLYLGRIDDRYIDFGKKRFEPSQRDLRAALDATLAGRRVPNPTTKAIGCYIPDA